MKPAPFTYYAPTTLAEALELTLEFGTDGKLLAGGQSLIPVMNFRLAQPYVIIDLNELPAINQIVALPNGGLRIGAMTRQVQLEHSALVAAHAPLMYEAMPHIAHPQIRNRGTLGGSLAHADPAGELPVISVALDAQFELSRTAGTRHVAARDFYQGLFTTALAPDEILTAVELPPLPPRSGCAFAELARRHGDYAQAGVAAVITLDQEGRCTAARLVFLNVGEIPIVADAAAAMLLGQRPDAALLAAAAAHAAQHEIAPDGDIHASAGYKRHLAGVLARRVLTTAAERAAQSA